MADGFPEWQDSQGVTLKWAGEEIIVTSLSYSRSASAEVDVTGMDSTAYTDPKNSNNKRVVKEVEFGIIEPGELQCEFVGPSTFDESKIGCKGTLSVGGLDNAVSGNAYLTNVQIQARAGESVTGSCTFRLAGS